MKSLFVASRKSKLFSSFALTIFFLLSIMLTACGGGEEPNVETTSGRNNSEAEEMEEAAEIVRDLAENVDELGEVAELMDTAVDMMEATPRPTPELPELPSPLTEDGRSFRYTSLNMTLDSWQLIDNETSDGVLCESDMPQFDLTVGDFAIALNVTMENTAAMPVTIGVREMVMEDGQGNPVNFLADGQFNSAAFGSQANIEFKPNETLTDVLCVGVYAGADLDTMVWVLGEGYDRVQVRVPLTPETAVESGTYSEASLDETFTYKEVEFTIPKVIVTTGVWGKYDDEGQAAIDHKWVLIPSQVVNQNNSNLFVEDDEVRLSFGDQSTAPVMPHYDPPYRLAPYGMSINTTAEGSVLFSVPADVEEVTLHLDASDNYEDSITIPITLPSG